MITASTLIGVKTYPPVSKHRWKGGPYSPPSVSAGSKLHCEMLGDVIVEAMTKAPIPWPAVTHRRQLIPILCGDLVRAVCEEEELAIAFYWGVSKYVVNKWPKPWPAARDRASCIPSWPSSGVTRSSERSGVTRTDCEGQD